MDPNALTKSQLKSALMGHDVSIPSTARKSMIVGLYADHVLFRNCNCRSATVRVKHGSKSKLTTSGFSSDDDIDNNQQLGQPKGKEKRQHLDENMATLQYTQAQIEVMSNAELLEILRQHGINCGPIVPSTRRVYQKKLLTMLSSGQVKWERHAEEDVDVRHRQVDLYSDEEEEEDDSDDDVESSSEEDDEMTSAELNIVQTKKGKAVAPERVAASGGLPNSPRRRIAPDGSVDRPASSSPYSREGLTAERFMRPNEGTPLRQRRRSSECGAVEPERQAKKERRVPLYIQFLIFIFVSIVIYLIIYNLEPVFKHPVSRLK